MQSARLLYYKDEYSDIYKGLIKTKTGHNLVYNITNPDNFINFISDIQMRNGVTQMEHAPLKVDPKSALPINSRVFLKFVYHMMFSVMFLFSLIRIRTFLKEQRKNVFGKGKANIKQF